LQWKGFRRTEADVIREKAVAAARKYGASDITFADNVCDTWALDFAKGLAREKTGIGSMMQLRVHHPQDFWAWLSLANVKVVTLGIEALSKPLLDGMGKKTTPVLNFLALKYLRELGIPSSSGLITHHPKSTLQDIAETERSLDHMSHLEPLAPSRFHLGYGSPVCRGISEQERGDLKVFHRFQLSDELGREIASTGYFLPPSLALPEEVARGWDRVYRRLVDWFHDDARKRAVFTRVKRAKAKGGGVHVVDGRWGETREYDLEGEVAAVFEMCHQGKLIGEIEDKRSLQWLLDQKLLLRSADHIVNLASRPRRELVDGLEELLPKKSKRADAAPRTASAL
jgi:hypothetical protein